MLTNEKLEALKAERKRLLLPNAGTFVSAMQLACKSINFIDELLAIREAGDEEVEKAYAEAEQSFKDQYDEELLTAEERAEAAGMLIDCTRKIYSFAITRDQQLREIRSACPCNCHNQPSSKEAMGLEEHANCGECIKGLLEEAESMQDSLCQKYEAELRETQAELAAEKEVSIGLQLMVDSLLESDEKSQQISTLAAERDEARKELAALKSAPGMEEVDALWNKWYRCFDDSEDGRVEDLADIARRSIAARDEEKKRADEAEHAMLEAVDAINEDYREVVGLLDHILSCIITVKQENTPEWMEYIAEEVNKINEAIGDPDRVVVNCCDIVIVRGKPEIVEGK